MNRKIKLGIIGTGIAAKELHLPVLQRLTEEFEIVAVCNHTEPKAKEFSELVGGVPYYLNYKKLLRDKNVEAIDILLPIELNYDVSKAALKAGKHVILEKPISANIKDAQRMLSFNKKYDTVMMVAENYRYRNSYKKAKDVINSGKLGKVYAAQWNVFYYNPADSKYGSVKWRQNHVYPGGFITDGGVHNTAALRYFFGEAVSVYSVTDQVNPAIGSHDTLFGILQFDSGVKVNLNLFHSSAGHAENRLLIFCEKGTIEISDAVVQIKYADSSVDSEDFGEDSGFYEEFMNFYNAITSGEKIVSTFEEAFRDFEIILALLTSAKKQKIISL